MPLTVFIIAMLRGELPSRDAQVIARRFGIAPDHAAGFLRLHTTHNAGR